MIIFMCLLLIVLLVLSSLVSLIYVWKRKEDKNFFVQIVVMILSIAGGVYGITQYPDFFTIAKALNYLSPLK